MMVYGTSEKEMDSRAMRRGDNRATDTGLRVGEAADGAMDLSDPRRSAYGLEQMTRSADGRRSARRQYRGDVNNPRRVEPRQVQWGGDALLEKGDGAAAVVVCGNGVGIVVRGGCVMAVQVGVRRRRNGQQTEGEHQPREHPRERALRATDGGWLVAR